MSRKKVNPHVMQVFHPQLFQLFLIIKYNLSRSSLLPQSTIKGFSIFFTKLIQLETD